MSGRRKARNRGPKGPIGLTGVAGVAGAAGATSLSSATPFWQEPMDPEDVFPIPGPAGIAGAPGAAGIAGALGLPGLDGIDGEDAIAPFGWPAFGVTTLTTGVTGAQNDYNPGLGKFTVEHWSGVADAAFTGLRGGAAGSIYIFKNTGTKIATFAHQSAASAAGNKHQLIATSGLTPVAPGGFLAAAHDGTNWNLVAHEQGSWITPIYNAGDFSGLNAMTWGVDAGDVITYSYKLDGKRMAVVFAFGLTTVGGTPDVVLLLAVPGGFTVSAPALALSLFARDAGVTRQGYVYVDPALNGGVKLRLTRTDELNWTAAVNATSVYGQTSFLVI